ncbi:MAG: SAM-dependent methyltransferase [Candidatus Neptunochlamydia sp.]|nr:SAM-dependent methyltransferase [Candidatus Neptunochlamydia sp.]
MLYLLPNLLDENLDHNPFIPSSVGEVVSSLDGMIAESERGARRYMKRFTNKFREIPIRLLNEHTQEIDSLIGPLQKGEKWGLISDRGLPVLADPGAHLIRRLHTLKVPIETLPGPSSIVYALQLSGLPAQNFTFHGCPPKDEKTLKEKLRTLPKNQTHLFIEAPYRTDKFLKTLIYNLQEETDLSVSWNLTLPSQGVKTEKIAQWKKAIPSLGKVPTVFVVRGKKS